MPSLLSSRGANVAVELYSIFVSGTNRESPTGNVLQDLSRSCKDYAGTIV